MVDSRAASPDGEIASAGRRPATISAKKATKPAPTRNLRMHANEGIFPTFFLSGFECSSFLWGEERKRRDINAELQHYEHAEEDYRLLPPLGIAVAREGIPWP